MNYIKLLNTAFTRFYEDDRLNPAHISLYIALFHQWNSSRFAPIFYVSRLEVMYMAKLGSKSTYHRCVNDLHDWNYLCYFPSKNPFKGSKIKMAVLDSSTEPDTGHCDPELEQLAEHYSPNTVPLEEHYRPTSEQALVSNTNIIKHKNGIKEPKDRQAVFIFFKQKGFNADEAKKFYRHYAQKNWQIGTEDIRDWRAIANSWMQKTKEFEQETTSKKTQESQIQDNLRTCKHKDYGQPL